jgi:transposase-like protein
MAKEGETGITMDAQIIPTESKQIREAVTEVFPEAPQQICHYHFVNNLGKRIFKEKYANPLMTP